MKAIKKVFALLLTAAMVLGMATTSLAAGNGSITITNASVGETYSVYKVFDLTYSGTAVSYTFTKTDNNTALYTALIGDTSPFTLEASVTTNVYNVSLKTDKTVTDVVDFLKTNLSLLGDATETQKAETTGTEETIELKFDELPLGYYYVTSTLGSVVSITSTKPDVQITDKNESPTVDKQVKEGDNWVEVNDVNIGDTVNFQTTINAYKGATNYVLHDKMSDGLSFNNDSVKVTVNGTELTAGNQYTLVTSSTDDCTFEITFTQTYLNTITGTTENPTKIVVTYSATVTKDAVIAGNGNTNKTKLDYGDDSETTWDTTTTYTWEFDILKYTGTTTNTLSGATFTLSKNSDGSNPIKLVAVVGKTNTYRVATTSDTDTVTSFTTDSSGKIYIEGLDSGTYYLTETAAPSGYNMLTEAVKVEIISTEGTGSDGSTILTQSVKVDDKAITGNQVEVENKTGTELPSTGGIGTTIFYVIGSVLVIGAAVLLITKKRMSGTQE